MTDNELKDMDANEDVSGGIDSEPILKGGDKAFPGDTWKGGQKAFPGDTWKGGSKGLAPDSMTKTAMKKTAKKKR